MLRTQQSALVQATNQQLIQIRQNELNYYLNIVSIFGQQAALISGFAYSSMTQISFSPLTGFAFYQIGQEIFWISTGLCMGVSIHVILTTSYLQLYAQGLAIHGPIGSMARAVYGLRQETKEIFIVYIIMVISFAVSMLFSFWTVMTIRAAAISTAFFLFIALLWWRYCLRIYNKFYVKRLFYLGSEPSTADDRDPSKPARKMQDAGTVADETGANGNDADESHGHFGDHAHDDGTGQVFHEGYLSINESESHQRAAIKKSDSWIRRYFVINDEGELYYYKDHTAFHAAADRPIRTRPVKVFEYEVSHSVTSAVDSSHSLPMGVTGDPNHYDQFNITLEYRDREEGVRPWHFRCDSIDEWNRWVEVFTKASTFQFQ